MSIKNITLALCAISLLSACSGKRPKGFGSNDAVNDAVSINDTFVSEVGSDRVFFDLNKYSIKASDLDTVRKQAAWLNEHAELRAMIEGHCDTRGTVDYNLALGERRSYAMKRALEKEGVDAARLDTVSYGKERPAAIGDTEAEHSQNRRAVTVIQR